MIGPHRLTSGLDALASSLLAATAVAISAAWLAVLLAGCAAVAGIGVTGDLLLSSLSLLIAFGVCACGTAVAAAASRFTAREPASRLRD